MSIGASTPVPAPPATRLDELVLEVASALADLPGGGSDEDIGRALADVARGTGADWVFILHLSENGRLLSVSHQWRPSGSSLSAARVASLPREDYPRWFDHLERRQPVHVPDPDEREPTAGGERSLLEAQGVRSASLLPMAAGRGQAGFLGLAWTDYSLPLNSREAALLTLVAGALAAALERQRADRALRDSQHNLEALLDGLDDYLFILDLAGRLLHANPSAQSRLGYALQELRRMTATDLYPALHRGEVLRLFSGHAQPTGQVSLAPLQARDGSHVAVETRVSQGMWSSQQVLFAFCRDVTEQKRALDGLRRFEARSSAILKAIPDAMLRVRRDGSIIDFSPGELPSEQGARLDHELAPELARACREAVEAALASGEKQLREFELGTAAGPRTFEARLSVLGEDEVLAIVRDISEQAHLERMKDVFITRASHELRTPITTALLMVDLIREGGEPAELEEYWEVLGLELQRQHDLVEDLLTVSRLEGGQATMSLESLDLAVLLREAVQTTSPMAAARRLTLLPFFPSELPHVRADASAMQRVLANLLDNAVKFTPAGGEVRLEAKPVADGVTIRVVDNGIGIPREELPQLFQRFFRASNVVRAEIQGAGIGLYIVKSIVEAHGGRVTVTSALDQGATFDLWLPAES